MSTVSPLDALRGAQRPGPKTEALPRLLLAGATGPLGNEVLSRVVGAQNYALVQVLAREPYVQGLRGMELLTQLHGDVQQWPVQSADVGLIMFEPPRPYYQRERALWTPRPDQLQAVAQWMQRCGVHTLAVVLPPVSVGFSKMPLAPSSPAFLRSSATTFSLLPSRDTAALDMAVTKAMDSNCAGGRR